MMTCVYQCGRKAAWPSTSGNVPTTRSSLRSQLRNHQPHSQRHIGRLCSLGSLCNLDNPGSHRSGSQRLPVSCPEAILCSPC